MTDIRRKSMRQGAKLHVHARVLRSSRPNIFFASLLISLLVIIAIIVISCNFYYYYYYEGAVAH